MCRVEAADRHHALEASKNPDSGVSVPPPPTCCHQSHGRPLQADDAQLPARQAVQPQQLRQQAATGSSATGRSGKHQQPRCSQRQQALQQYGH